MKNPVAKPDFFIAGAFSFKPITSFVPAICCNPGFAADPGCRGFRDCPAAHERNTFGSLVPCPWRIKYADSKFQPGKHQQQQYQQIRNQAIVLFSHFS